MSRSKSREASRFIPQYGFDSPGAIRTTLIIGIAILSLGPIGEEAGFISADASLALGAAGCAIAAVGVALIAYGAQGKYRVRGRMLAMIPWRGDEAVLDAATGRGLLAVGAAAKLKTGAVVGIDGRDGSDPTGAAAASARRNARIEGVADRVEIRDGDIRRADFPDRAFDVVLSLRGLGRLPRADRAGACREIARLLKPGGRAVIADSAPPGAAAKALAAAGLAIERKTSCFIDARLPMWIICARKP